MFGGRARYLALDLIRGIWMRFRAAVRRVSSIRMLLISEALDSQSLAGDIGRGTCTGLEHGAFVSDVGAGTTPRPPTSPAAKSLMTSP